MNDTWIPGVRFQHAPDAERIAREIGYIYFNPLVDVVIARMNQRTRECMGGAIYTQFTGAGGSVVMHCAAFHPNWLNRALLWVCFDYPFNQMGVDKIFAQIPADNQRSLDFNKNLGFAVEHVIKDVYAGGEDMVLTSITRDKCRFLNHPPKLVSEPAANG